MANMETPAASSFVTDDEINQWLNDGIKQLYDKLIHARGEDYWSTSSSTPFVSGTALYSLPTDFYQLLEVVADDGGQNYFRVMRFQRGETANVMNQHAFGFTYGTVPTALDLRFRLGTNYIEFRPTPNFTGWNFTLYYVPIVNELKTDGSTINGVHGWEDYAVIWAAIRCLTKEESDTAGLVAQLKLLDQRIGQMAPNRDSSQNRRVSDTRMDSAGNGWPRRIRGW